VAELVTLADVARAAGVSLATASRSLSGAAGRTVRAELKARVMQAAADLEYSPNANAQAMVRGTTTTVGLIVHDIADPFAAAVASGVMAAAAERDLIVTIASTMWDPETEIRHVEALRRQRARAVILAGSRFADEDVAARLAAQVAGITAAGGQVSAIGQRALPVDTLVMENADGARRLARVLWDLGYRSFAILAGPESVLTSEERLTGFRNGLRDRGHELANENMIGTHIEVEAVFAVNDVMAVGAMAALREQGHRVPGDMALAGFDDIATLRDVRPSLTTVRLPLVQMGRRALELALNQQPGAEPLALPVRGEVVVRASTPART